MSGHGGHRPGSGRMRIYASKKQSNIVWQRGHRRISIDCTVYSSWVAARIKCGYNTDSDFASHLLSLERRRRENDPVISNVKRTGRTEEEAAVPSKRQRHLSGHPLSTSTPVKPVTINVQSPALSLDAVDATGDLDVTGISEFSVNNSSYQVANDSVILQSDSGKYQDSDNPLSDSDSDGEGDSDDHKEKTERAMADALHELDEDYGEEESYNSSEGTDIDDLEQTMSLEENESGSELLAEDQMFSDLETDSEWIDPSPSSPSSTPQCSTSASISALPTSSSSVPLPVTTMSSVSFTASSTTTSSGHTYASALSVPVSSGASTSVALPVSSAASTSVSTSAVSSLLPPACAPLSVPVQGSGVSSNPLSVPVTSAQTVTSATAPSQKYPKLSRYEERNMLKEELSLVGQTKVICSLDLLLDLFKRCQHPGCTKDAVIKKKYLNGPTVVIKWSCCMGHKGTFSSSRDLNDIYSNNLQLVASIMVSGNNFAKVEKMANFLGLSFISDSTFYRMQRLYFIPAIDE
ncbi:uncharacterized protein [Montipora foliosa]|uniref:uncharacterized protein n=1 Tax=Montipora foliosa TaxID=591990 RepID=UPI0035F1A396